MHYQWILSLRALENKGCTNYWWASPTIIKFVIESLSRAEDLKKNCQCNDCLHIWVCPYQRQVEEVEQVFSCESFVVNVEEKVTSDFTKSSSVGCLYKSEREALNGLLCGNVWLNYLACRDLCFFLFYVDHL